MTRHLSREELALLERPEPKPAMTRKDKLLRWADLVERAEHVYMCHGLEHRFDPDGYAWCDSPMAIAYGDSVLREAGLAGCTVGAARNFFELTLDDMHAFTCDCGGIVDGRCMANRIRRMAAGSSALTGGVVRLGAAWGVLLDALPR